MVDNPTSGQAPQERTGARGGREEGTGRGRRRNRRRGGGGGDGSATIVSTPNGGPSQAPVTQPHQPPPTQLIQPPQDLIVPQTSVPTGRSREGGRGRPSRGRGGGGGASTVASTPQTNSGRSGGFSRAQVTQAQQPLPVHASQPVRPSQDLIVTQNLVPAGRGREGGRGRPSRGLGGTRQGSGRSTELGRPVQGTHRPFGGHLTGAGGASTTGDSTSRTAGPSLSGDAPAFIPGQQFEPSGSKPPAQQTHRAPRKRVKVKSTAADLPTRIHEDIDHGQYECVICTNEIFGNSKVWSHDSGCWTVVHLTCVKKWFETNEKQGNWRCPGCNSEIEMPPTSYHCWCGKEPNPQTIRGIPPHSCGQTCSKSRETCPHPCSMQCHAGPCPPCQVMGPPEPCCCGKHTSVKRCADTDYKSGWHCDEPCGDLLPCGQHACEQRCHRGVCGACEIPVSSICYCGKVQKQMPCELRADIRESFNYGQVDAETMPQPPAGLPPSCFEGSFDCGETCGRLFDCGEHQCQQRCHAQDEDPPHCPYSPDVLTSCPCGKTLLEDISNQPRTSCQDPIPHCTKQCGKLLACGHGCNKTCHGDAEKCGPCFETVAISCRCARVTTNTLCFQGREEVQPMCMRICRAQLNCGRHECGERCCPGEKRAATRKKAKNTNIHDIEAEHICIRACDRPLKCGRHRCEQTCHRGQCPSCVDAVFEEIACACGRTILQPPQPCGTGPPECRYTCTRPSPCGHAVEHQCHTDDVSCPKCPFLVSRGCMCGKKTLINQPCGGTEARCGLVCGRKLKCGVHTCSKTCHREGECEDANVVGSHCLQSCGKTRKSCNHVCTDTCHAPFACNENKPCHSKAILTCACQNLKKEVRCLATTENADPIRKTLECDDECLRLQRNHKLVEALHIDPASHTDGHIPFTMDTLRIFAGSQSWCQSIEKEFRLFAADNQLRRKRFDPMPSHQRAFLHHLAEDFGFDTLSEDPEPYRHVSVFKTPKFVGAPLKTLAQSLKIKTAKSAKVAPVAATAVNARQEPFNALLLTGARFGLTVEEVQRRLFYLLPAHPRGNFEFDVRFLPGDEVLMVPHKSVEEAVGPWRTGGMGVVEVAVLKELKAAATGRLVEEGKIGDGVVMVAADKTGKVRRREVGGGGWNTVVSRAARRGDREGTTGAGASAAGSGSGFGTAVAGPSTAVFPASARGPGGWSWSRVPTGGGGSTSGGAGGGGMSVSVSIAPPRREGMMALGRKKVKEVKKEEPVEEDWETAADHMDKEKEDDKEDGEACRGVDVSGSV